MLLLLHKCDIRGSDGLLRLRLVVALDTGEGIFGGGEGTEKFVSACLTRAAWEALKAHVADGHGEDSFVVGQTDHQVVAEGLALSIHEAGGGIKIAFAVYLDRAAVREVESEAQHAADAC